MGTGRFYGYEINAEQKERIKFVQQNFTDLYDYLDIYIPEGREKSLYTTKLEEACMWAVKGMSRKYYELNNETTNEKLY